MGNTEKRKKVYNDELPREAVGKLFNDHVKVEPKETGYTKSDGAEQKGDDYDENIAALYEDEGDDSYKEYIAKSTAERASMRRMKEQQTRVHARPPEPSLTSAYKKEVLKPSGQEQDFYDVDYEISIKDVFYAYKYAIIGISFVIIILFGFLVFRINSVTNDYNQVKASIEESNTYKEEAQSLAIGLEDLKQENLDLKDKNSSLQNEIASLKNDEVNSEPDPSVNNAPASSPVPSNAPVQNTPATNASGQKTHTVVAGDNFWSISEKYYGTGIRDKDIMAANGITDPASLQIGVVIIIP